MYKTIYKITLCKLVGYTFTTGCFDTEEMNTEAVYLKIRTEKYHS